MDDQNTFWIQVLLGIIGTLSMLVLTGVLWFVRLVHNDVKELVKSIKDTEEKNRAEIDEVADRVNLHHVSLYGAFEKNGLVGDVKAIMDIVYERRSLPRE